jgi:hypothetical protein
MTTPRIYAKKTKVPVVVTRAEIERTLTAYGATGFAFAQDIGKSMVAFRMNKRHVRFTLTLPKGASAQDERQRWRALLLVIKAKLEAVRANITVFDEEFLAHIVMPNGQTVADLLRDQIAAAYDSGQMPPLLIFRPSDEG